MKIYILLAEGFETIEALSPADVMKRAGIEVELLSISDNWTVMSSQGIEVTADGLLADGDFKDGDALVLPGGFPGYKNLCESRQVCSLARHYHASGKLLAAICGAPTLLVQEGIATGSTLTAHTSVKDQMTDYNYTGNDVEICGNLITAIGAGHSVDFGLAILRELKGEEAVAKVKKGMELS